MIAGIDEAGRGPIIGPMVMAVVVIEKKDEATLKKWGVKDSKLLSPKERENLFEKISKKYKYELITLSPQEIDQALADPDNNLNWLEAQTSATLLNRVNPQQAILNCPSTNIKAYTAYVKQLLNADMKLIVEHGADTNYLVCGAASILAKVTRDRHIKALQETLGIDFGSGYPSDPKTQVFVKENFNNEKYQPLFRTSWETYKRLVAHKQQKKLGEF